MINASLAEYVVRFIDLTSTGPTIDKKLKQVMVIQCYIVKWIYHIYTNTSYIPCNVKEDIGFLYREMMQYLWKVIVEIFMGWRKYMIKETHEPLWSSERS